MAQGGGSVSSPIAELREDVDALDTLMGDTSISGIGNGTVTGAISTINNNLSANTMRTASAYVTCDSNGIAWIPRSVFNPDNTRIIAMYCIDKLVEYYATIDSGNSYYAVKITNLDGTPASHDYIYYTYLPL